MRRMTRSSACRRPCRPGRAPGNAPTPSSSTPSPSTTRAHTRLLRRCCLDFVNHETRMRVRVHCRDSARHGPTLTARTRCHQLVAHICTAPMVIVRFQNKLKVVLEVK